jgi:hypothetical protein
MLEEIFDQTVDALEYVSKKTGISYKKLNALGLLIVSGVIIVLSITSTQSTRK